MYKLEKYGNNKYKINYYRKYYEHIKREKK